MAIILYFIIVIVLGAIAILFSFYPAYLAFILSIIIPIISLTILIINRLCIRIKINIKEEVVSKGDKLSVCIEAKNMGIFVSGEMVAYIELYYGEHKRIRKKICFSAVPFKQSVANFEIAAEYAGNLRIICKKALLYDYLRIFKIKLFRRKKEYRVQVLPKPLPVQIIYNQSENHEIIEASMYHPFKKGYDRTELFNVREYVPGDNLRDIHWKLTDRMDKYMVKEYSLPISIGLGVVVDLTEYIGEFDGIVVADKIMEVFYSICTNIILEEKRYSIIYTNKNNGQMDGCIIENENDLTEALNVIMNVMTLQSDEKIEDESIMLDKCQQQNIIYITSCISEHLAQKIKSSAGNKKIIIILVALNENDANRQIEMLDNRVQYYVLNAKLHGMGNINEIRF